MTQPKGRALHYVFRVGNRQRAYDFYVKLLGMKVLRHEEFSEGCEATCNGLVVFADGLPSHFSTFIPKPKFLIVIETAPDWPSKRQFSAHDSEP